MQILPREKKKNSNPSSPKKSTSPKIVDITDEVAQYSKYAQKANTAKASNLVKTTNSDPKNIFADSKSANPRTDNPRTPADNSEYDKISAATQTIPEKKIKSSKTQETETKNTKTIEDKDTTIENQEKPTQITVTKYKLIQISKSQHSFNIQSEIAKLKIPIPLTELVKNDLYKSTITETLNMNDGEDVINLNDDQP